MDRRDAAVPGVSGVDRRPTILVVSIEYPWPATTGSRIRLANTLRALSTLGDVDFLAAVPAERCPEDPRWDDVVPVRRVEIVRRHDAGGSSARKWRALGARLPRRLAAPDWGAVRSAAERWAAPSYDLVWYCRVDGYVHLNDLVGGPVVVDFDDLEDRVLRYRRRMLLDRRDAKGSSPSALRRYASLGLDAVDIGRWRRLYQQVSGAVACTTVCSASDAARIPGALVLPNVYEPHGEPVPPREPDPEHPTFTMIALLSFDANADAARFFAREVLPLVRAVVPGARLRLVGRAGDQAVELERFDGVELRGEVDDVGPELRETDVVVVPMRFGGGTRLKVLEAFAYGVPVVSTSLGCEGLDVVDGEQLLVADDPGSLADACVRLLFDRPLREHLVEQAHDHWSRRFRMPAAVAAVQAASRRALGKVSPPAERASR